MAISFLYLVLCYVHLWMGCRSNFTLHPFSNVSDYGIDENNSSLLSEGVTFSTTFHYPSASRPSALDKILSLAKESVVDDDLPEDANNVLAFPASENLPNVAAEEKPGLPKPEKCPLGDLDCLPSTDDPIPDSTTQEDDKHDEDILPEMTVTPFESTTRSVVTLTIGLSDQTPGTSPKSTVTGSLAFPTTFSASASASENLIPIESPVAGRKEVHSEPKGVTTPLSHDEKADARKPIRDRQQENANNEQIPKTSPTLIPDEADDKGVGIKNDVHDNHASSDRQGNNNQIHSPAGEFTKSFEMHETPKHLTKEPPMKIPDEPKKPENPLDQLTKYYPTSTQDHSTETSFEKPQNATSVASVPNSEIVTFSSATTAAVWSVIPTGDKEPELPILTSSTAQPSSTARDVKPTSSTEIPSATHGAPSPPEWVINQTCTQLPVCVRVRVSGSICSDDGTAREWFAELVVSAVSKYVHDAIHPARVAVYTADCGSSESKRVDSFVFFLVDPSGEYEEDLTSIAGILLRRMAKRSKGRNSSPLQILSAKLVEKDNENDEDREGGGERGPLKETAHTAGTSPPPFVVSHNSGMIAAVAISAVAGACLCLLCLLMVVMKQRLASQQQQLQHVNGNRPPNGLDAYSLDSFSINASFRRRRPGRCSAGSFTNHAFVGDSDDMALLSKRMSAAALSALLKNHKTVIDEEFQKIPMNMPKPREIPPGAEVKNRYVNVVPNAKTRVILADNTDDPVKTYINANYVRGYDNRPSFYIACQSPLAEYVEDFWKMVWEQQSRVIIMLTMLEENGIRRCAPYFPESTLECRQLHGDYQITLLKKDVREFYTVSTFKLYCIEKNLFREIRHFWYTSWPAVGVPNDPMSLITFLLQARPFMNCNSGPTVVHCSAGTGRTGTVIALDRCMREYEESRTMDIVQCVAQMRRDRGGAVQNKQQYLLIHEAMMEYASYTANQSNRASIQSNELEFHSQSSPQKKS